MDTSKATARPWRADREPLPSSRFANPRAAYIPIRSAAGTVALVVSGNGRDFANAALIVRAVNSHEAMVAALRDLLDGSDPWDERATRARAALALAEQGGG